MQYAQEMLSVDLWQNRFRELGIDDVIHRDCPACRGEFQYLVGDRLRQSEEVLCGRKAVQIRRVTGDPIDLESIAAGGTHSAGPNNQVFCPAVPG